MDQKYTSKEKLHFRDKYSSNNLSKLKRPTLRAKIVITVK